MSGWKPVDADVRHAVEHEGNTTFMIEAGAGTGKTELMVYRVVAMIRSGAATVDQLVVITFTDDAAGEISARTRQALELLLAGSDAEVGGARLAPLTDEERVRVRAALDGIHRAHIQTIHAFASSLLRERPVEAGIDPAFVTLDEMQESAAFDAAFDAWLDHVLDAAPPELALAMERGIGPKQIRSLAETLQAHRAVLPLALPKVTMPQVDEFVADLLVASAELQKLTAFVGKDDRGLQDIEGIITFANQVALLWDEGDEAAVVRVILTQWPDIKPSAGRKTDWTDKPSADAAEQHRKSVCDALTPLQKEMGTAILLGVLPLVQGFVLDYAAQRKRDGVATYDDLLLWAQELLRDDAAREYFRGHFTRIIVDEFQDTDPVQADIVFCLAAQGPPPATGTWTGMTPNPGALTVVGDPKQSIYRFRRADLAVFDAIKTGVMEPHRVQIGQNFRSREGVIDWINGVFDAQFTEEPGVQPGNTTLVHAPRAEEFDAPAIHVARGTPHEKIGPSRREEADLLARMLIHAQQDEWPVYDKTLATVRPITWGDMVVLVPAWTEFDEYRRAFRAMGVPFRVGGGKGFFKRDEVGHVCHLLEAIDDPLNDISVAAALRSPIFGCSDDELLLAMGTGRGINYRQYSTKDCPPRVADGLRAIRDMHDVLPRLTLMEAVEMAVDRSLLVEQALAHPGEEQAAANLMKMVDMARRFADVSATSGLRDFARWMREQRELEEDDFRPSLREGDAGMADAGDDVVRFMTIHASKALEFPLVALANMSGRRNINRSPIPDRDANRLHFHVKSFGGTHFATPGYDEKWEPEKKAQAAEITRLMYVAATRARDHLVIPIAIDPTKVGPYMKQLQPHLPAGVGVDDDDEPTDGPIEVVSPEVLAAVKPLPVREVREASEDEINRVDLERAEWAVRRVDVIEQAAAELRVTAATAHGQRPDSTDDNSASDPDPRPVIVGPSQDSSDTEATRKGKALHLVMELVDYANPGDLDAVVAHACAAEGAEGHETEIREWVANCLGSEAVARAIASDEMHREVPFTVKVGDGFEVGRIDLLIREGNTITVIDWKSDNITPGNEVAQAQEHHAGQANAYVRALKMAVPELAVKEVIFVFARTGGEAAIGLEPDALF